MGDILKMQYEFLKRLFGGDDAKATWLRNLAKGICHEEVAKKGPP
jgi:hypothetical protein